MGIAETIEVMLLIYGFEVDFNFFTAYPQMFAVRNRFANPQTKTLSPQLADLRTGLRKCPAQLFSMGKDILKPKRSVLSDEYFEMLTFLKGN